jgi:hypothetical protein
VDGKVEEMKNSIVTTFVLTAFLSFGCGDVPPEPEASAPPLPAESPAPLPDTDAAQPDPVASPPESSAPAATAENPVPRGPVRTPDRPRSPDDIERISIPDFQRLHAAGGAVLVDVRSRVAYVQGHIPGAISIPATELANSLHLLPRDRKIVTYCT